MDPQTIPWLEEMRKEAFNANRDKLPALLHGDRLLALIAIAEATQEFVNPDIPFVIGMSATLADAVEKAAKIS